METGVRRANEPVKAARLGMASEYEDRKQLTFEQAEGVEPLPTQLQLKEITPRPQMRTFRERDRGFLESVCITGWANAHGGKVRMWRIASGILSFKGFTAAKSEESRIRGESEAIPAGLQMAASLLIRRSAVERRLEAGNEGA
jgi:hypothetical protein